MFEKVTVEIATHKGVFEAWKVFTSPEYIIQWNSASNDWHCPKAINNLVVNGEFCYRMESIDKKYGFDFSGKYSTIEQYKKIIYELGDLREVEVEFIETNNVLIVREIFDAEKENPIELQKSGWQAILNNYKTVLEKQ